MNITKLLKRSFHHGRGVFFMTTLAGKNLFGQIHVYVKVLPLPLTSTHPAAMPHNAGEDNGHRSAVIPPDPSLYG